MEETELLHRYVREGSEQAFRELVQRKVGLVYSAALRQVGGDPHLAEEVTQAVFTALAAKARRVMNHPSLSGWLHTSTHFAAAKLLRTERRRRHHETQAGHEAPTTVAPAAPQSITWQEISAVLDDAVRELPESDRAAVLLRFFEGHTFAAVATRLGLTEDATRKRINRALVRLRTGLERRGLACTTTALSATLTEGAMTAVPAGLAVSAATGALTAAAAGQFVAAGTLFFAMKKSAVAVAILLLATTATVVVLQRPEQTSQPPAPVSLPVTTAPAQAAASMVSVAPPAPLTTQPSAAVAPGSSVPKEDLLDFDAIMEARKRRDAEVARMNVAASTQMAEAMRVDLDPNAAPSPAVNVAALAELQDAASALAYFRAVALGDLAAHLQYVYTIAGTRREMLMPALFQVWTERDAAGAMSAATQAGQRVVQWALSGWAKSDLSAALAWAQASPAVSHLINVQAVINSSAAEGRESTLAAWLLGIAPSLSPQERKNYTGTLIRAWNPADISTAESLMNQMETTYPGSASDAAYALGNVAAKISPSEVYRRLGRQDEATAKGIISGAVSYYLSSNQPDQLRQFIALADSLNDSLHDSVITSMGSSLMLRDPDLAFEVYRLARDPKTRERLLINLAKEIGREKPAFAMKVALSLSGERTEQAVILIDAYQTWSKNDPAAARKALDQPGFPADVRSKLLEQE
jgi:RNA polymerase sigma factor (sigma-70 family)